MRTDMQIKPMRLVNSIPESISIEITTKCSLNCVYCNRKREDGSRGVGAEVIKLLMRIYLSDNI